MTVKKTSIECNRGILAGFRVETQLKLKFYVTLMRLCPALAAARFD